VVRTANLPPEVHQIFVQVSAREIPLLDFEQWLYGKKELEEILPGKTYLNLLELNYQDQSTFFELAKLLKDFVDPGSVEAYELRKVIERLEAEGEDFPQALQECYVLYADGCNFLEVLGLKWGLLLRVPPGKFDLVATTKTAPSGRVIESTFFEKRLPDGRGVRFRLDGNFETFIK
jgi:hypothetical protein